MYARETSTNVLTLSISGRRKTTAHSNDPHTSIAKSPDRKYSAQYNNIKKNLLIDSSSKNSLSTHQTRTIFKYVRGHVYVQQS